MAASEKIRVRLRSYEHSLIDQAVTCVQLSITTGAS